MALFYDSEEQENKRVSWDLTPSLRMNSDTFTQASSPWSPREEGGATTEEGGATTEEGGRGRFWGGTILFCTSQGSPREGSVVTQI